MNKEQPLLVLEKVGKIYTGGLEVLKDISLTVKAGESVAIVGPSGSGKSTLLNIIGTLDLPTAGKVEFEGENILGFDDKKRAEFRNRKMGFVFQLHHLLPQCTVLENVLVPSLVNSDSKNADARARELLAEVGLAGRMEYRPGKLSGGEQQRVAVVRAMINNPRLLLADEPTGSLDHAGAEKLGDLLVKLNKDHGLTMIVVTHSLSLAGRMGRIYELSDGRLVSKFGKGS